ncbi:MAG: SPOR domain-containing protein, partial [Candidatus Margulisbacteria bacterium]|nr:SPOR domain-containing protein [Candidatus Margulisiibacteriota bacterium]
MENQNPIEPERKEEPSRAAPLVKNLLIFLLLVVVIIASFWVSFQLGKKILVPVKKPEAKIEVAIPEPPPSIAGLQKAGLLSKEAEQVAKPTAEKRVCAPAAVGKYYKVQAGFFVVKTNANNMVSKLKSQGFDAFIVKLGRGWRVQAGAFKSKKYALERQRALKAKGFDSALVCE